MSIYCDCVHSATYRELCTYVGQVSAGTRSHIRSGMIQQYWYTADCTAADDTRPRLNTRTHFTTSYCIERPEKLSHATFQLTN